MENIREIVRFELNKLSEEGKEPNPKNPFPEWFDIGAFTRRLEKQNNSMHQTLINIDVIASSDEYDCESKLNMILHQTLNWDKN